MIIIIAVAFEAKACKPTRHLPADRRPAKCCEQLLLAIVVIIHHSGSHGGLIARLRLEIAKQRPARPDQHTKCRDDI